MATNTRAMVLVMPRVPLRILLTKSVIRCTTTSRLLAATLSSGLTSRLRAGATLATM